MKKFSVILFVLLQFTFVQTNSASINTKEAWRIGCNYIENNGFDIILRDEPTHYILSTDSSDVIAFVYSGTNRGIVVVAADERLSPVIFHSIDGVFDENSPLNYILTADLNKRLENHNFQSEKAKSKQKVEWQRLINYNGEKPDYQQWPAEGTTSTGGWTETQWHQNAPYNAFCPIKLNNGQRSVTGCPATAMAQILHFHRRVNGTRFNSTDRYYHNYTQSFWIDDAWETYQFLSFNALNQYLEDIENKYAVDDELNNNEMAALSLAAGFACKSVYDPQGSGTFSVNQAYVAFQRFGFSQSVILDDSFTDEQIREKMIQNIQNALPVHLATVDINWYYGHNVVCDGYRDNGFFRINFGWGGSYDGWYSLPEGFPMSLTVFEGIVADIIPPPTYALTLTTSPVDIGATILGGGEYVEGAVVEISTGNVQGYTFQSWTGTEEDLQLIADVFAQTTTITMPNRDVSLTAYYTEVPTFTVTFLLKNTYSTPIEGANIFIEEIDTTLTTDMSGEASISLPNGTYSFSVLIGDNNLYNDTFIINGENINLIIVLNIVADKISKNESFSFYPNPFSDEVTIVNAEGGFLKIMDVLGQILFFESIHSNHHSIHLANFPKGIYIVSIGYPSEYLYIKRVLKQ